MTAPNHPIFERFQPYRGPSRRGCIIFDFLGSFVRREFVRSQDPPNPPFVEPDYPPASEDLFAWVDLLESVTFASGSFTMLELGAGYGCWSVRAALAVRQRGDIPCHLITVEPEPVHHRWIRQYFEEHGIDPSQHRLIFAAVADRPGTANFCVYSPYVKECGPDVWQGQLLAAGNEAVEAEAGEYEGHRLVRLSSGFAAIEVPIVTVEMVLDGVPRVDFVHVDVQGEELRAISAGIDVLNLKAKRMNIGTHGSDVEQGLRELLTHHGWTRLADYPGNGTSNTPYGEIRFQDGVQSWTNPRLPDWRH